EGSADIKTKKFVLRGVLRLWKEPPHPPRLRGIKGRAQHTTKGATPTSFEGGNEGLKWSTHRRPAEARRNFHDGLEDHWVQVEVTMGIDVIQFQPQCVKALG